MRLSAARWPSTPTSANGAASTGADLTDDDAANLAAMGEYFQNVSQRSEKMVANMLTLASAFPSPSCHKEGRWQ